ncbi:hypothetical protein MB84_28485 (plasmid) [Pandoraea oxalativorans]|uniref:Uncharacterized protein n=1 Tax=Pandoraea oxalativorans TaxID=573737 RepID=A0A0G3IC05_9BURK|nr:hypothetical protein MB84_28485 [Pandoraea oxalativorans]
MARRMLHRDPLAPLAIRLSGTFGNRRRAAAPCLGTDNVGHAGASEAARFREASDELPTSFRRASDALPKSF